MAEKKTEKKEMTFEEKEGRLDEIIEKLEQDEKLTLEETSKLYTEGQELLTGMKKELEDMKKKVTSEVVLEK